MAADTITCPNCGHNFDVEQALSGKLEARFKAEYQEKKAMHMIWAQREKQIWAVQENIATLFGSITGIAGKELETAEVLQLPDREVEE